METQVKKHTVEPSSVKTKKISKLGQWMDSHKGGIITVVDRRAVNK